jgi:hypothetical protein
MMFGGGWVSFRRCLGNDGFVSIWGGVGVPELVKRVGGFVKSLAPAVKGL